MLVVVALCLRWDGKTTGVIDVKEVTLKFGEGWQSFVV